MESTNELQLLSCQQPGNISIDNLSEMKTALAEILARYENIVYTEDGLKAAKEDKKKLRQLRKDIDERRKEIKRAYLVPYNNFESQVKELLAMIDTPLEQINGFVTEIEDREKQTKRAEIENYFNHRSGALNAMARQVWESPAFFDPKWINKTTSPKTWQTAVDEKISLAARNLQTIQATSGQHIGAVTTRYLETLSMDGLAEYKASLEAAEAAVENAVVSVEEEDRVIGYKVLRLTGTQQQFAQIIDQMELLGIEVDEIEDGIPQPMKELSIPDFDTFVAFDIETTGTYGAANNDAAPEITEIGAVKVVNGKITDRFSELANPGRKIVPRIARLTHITDEMLTDKPPVEEVIRRFKEFIGDSTLVGHNIKNCDIPYISKAAKRAGVVIENTFFDTYRYAKKLKDLHGWENVKLEYLSQQFGVEQPDAHRAWCDAEANVGVYLRLKEMG